jgi:hypothetical protein
MPAKKAAKEVTEAAKKAPAKKAAKKAAAKKAPAVKTEAVAAKKAAAPKKAVAPKKAETPKPTVEAISRAAYMNYLHRVANGLPGDAQSDWVEAERALVGV